MRFLDKLFGRRERNERLQDQLKNELETFIRKVQLEFIGYTFD